MYRNLQNRLDGETFQLKRGLAQMLCGGVIMDVTNAEQARIAEQSGAVAVMALERIPAEIRHVGGVARMSAPELVDSIQAAVSIPVMAKCRIGHGAEGQVLQALSVDFVDESEVLTPADEVNHIDKWQFDIPFVCGATDLGSALRRIAEGAALIRTKGEAGTGNITEAVRHLRQLRREIEVLAGMGLDACTEQAKVLDAPLELVSAVAELGALPVPMFCAGGIATPADVALVRQLGAEAVFVGSGIFLSQDPSARAAAIVQACIHYDDPARIASVSRGLGGAMSGFDLRTPQDSLARFSDRGC